MAEIVTRKCVKCGLTFKFDIEEGSKYLVDCEEMFICKSCFVDCI